MQTRRNPLLILLLALGFFLAACGGGATQSTATPTKPAAQNTQPVAQVESTTTQAPDVPTATPTAASTEASEPGRAATATPGRSGTDNPPANTNPTNTPVPPVANTPTPTAPNAPSGDATKPPVVITIPTREPEGPEVGMPVRFKIGKIGVDAAIEYVGVLPPDKDGKRAMDVPKAWENVAWYKEDSGGYRPGEKGNSVIAGHVDSKTGPAVFYKLGELEIGDEVTVLDDKNQELRFKVTKMDTYYNEEAPLFEIFGFTNKKRLNLITCQGSFNQETGYDQKLVVYTELVEGEERDS